MGVDLERDIVLACHLPSLADHFDVGRVERMGRHRRRDPRVVPVFTNEGLGGGERFVRCLVIWRRETDDRLTKDRPQSRSIGGSRNFVFEVVHVGKSRRPASSHLDRSEQSAPIDELLVHVSCLGGKDEIVEPFHQRHVVRQPAKQYHRHMAMGVYEPGNHEMPRRIHHLSGVGKRTSRLDERHDALPADRNRRPFEDPHLSVHGHDRAALDQPIDRLRLK